ncbi:RloB family protein [Kangiella koreensis]|uniref:CRISPR-associated protein, Csm2 family n=1 Tax=Kangiella koreensis (strain DSM 16069 / JCM 12317 / KCTC 12182 / SW-125) TaxID=523791 RepID=C7R9F0_KANKD|nr:RloB family protein [Kangiella koreensis]ACV26041.1 CRISPR-associated protein, Csm2 family [Kangiella koreensis DSM 16069]
MGSEDLFHKRKAKAKQQLERKSKLRSPYDNVLIVVEGEKTEKDYLNALIDKYKINTANFEVVGKGEGPMSIVSTAVQKYDQAYASPNRFDQVFCVFDRDSFGDFNDAVDLCASKNSDVINNMVDSGEKPEEGREYFKAITSNPCFEYWVLLHLNYTDKGYSATGNRSICGKVVDDIKALIGTYEKGSITNLDFLFEDDCIAAAIKNSERALSQTLESGSQTYTLVHEVVIYMQSLSKD